MVSRGIERQGWRERGKETGKERGKGEGNRQLDSCPGRSSAKAAASFEVYLIPNTRGEGEGHPVCEGVCECVCVCVSVSVYVCVCIVNNDATCGARVCLLSKDLPAWTVAQTKLIKIWPRHFGLRVARRGQSVQKRRRSQSQRSKAKRRRRQRLRSNE